MQTPLPTAARDVRAINVPRTKDRGGFGIVGLLTIMTEYME